MTTPIINLSSKEESVVERFRRYRKGGLLLKKFQPGGVTKFLTQEETARNKKRNKKRQELLKADGYNVTVGNPWGPWQQQQWEEYVKKQPIQKTPGTAQDTFTKELDSWIKNNPIAYGIQTKDFRHFLINLARTESSFNPNAANKDKTKFGYFQTSGRKDKIDQFDDAFKHMAMLFKESITKEDLRRARELGITQSELLAKYWNQQNRVTNYLHRGVDDADGNGTLISTYHNNDTSTLDMSQYVPEAITSDYVVLGKGQSAGSIAPRVRNANIDYTDRVESVNSMNKGRIFGNRRYPNVWPGDTLYINRPYK